MISDILRELNEAVSPLIRTSRMHHDIDASHIGPPKEDDVAQIITDQITGDPRTIKQLFTGRKYGLKYYQREYAWTESNLSELLDDLSVRFLNEYDATHERPRVATYRPYFLGPIVTANEGGILYLVDGQQRLTTLTLLLIHLLRVGGDPESELRPLGAGIK